MSSICTICPCTHSGNDDAHLQCDFCGREWCEYHGDSLELTANGDCICEDCRDKLEAEEQAKQDDIEWQWQLEEQATTIKE